MGITRKKHGKRGWYRKRRGGSYFNRSMKLVGKGIKDLLTPRDEKRKRTGEMIEGWGSSRKTVDQKRIHTTVTRARVCKS